VSAGNAASISLRGGNNQVAGTGTPVPTPPSVIVRDRFNNPKSGITVTFAIGSGAARFPAQSTRLTRAVLLRWEVGASARWAQTHSPQLPPEQELLGILYFHRGRDPARGLGSSRRDRRKPGSCLLCASERRRRSRG
jgi:hypothetical protein